MNEGQWIGNMFVLGQDPSSVYYLRCACTEEFIYAPGSSTNRCTMGGQAHAICPKCRTMWDKEIKPRVLTPKRFFMVHLCVDSEDKSGIEKAELSPYGAGEARSPAEFILKCVSEFSGIDYRGMYVSEMTEEDYRKFREHMAEYHTTLAAFALSKLFGVDE